MSPSPPLLRVQHSPCNMKFGQLPTLEPDRALERVAVAIKGKVGS